MILDSIHQAGKYAALHPMFSKAFAIVGDGRLSGMQRGRNEIQGDRMYVSVGVEKRRPRAHAPLEAHRKYVDIHVPLQGSDLIGWKTLSSCVKLRQLYHSANDVMFFSDEPESWLTVGVGSFAIFFPEDAHAPLVGEGTILKAVFKVMIG